MTSSLSRLRPIPLAVSSDLEAAAYEHGYRSFSGESDGWLFAISATVPGEIGLAGAREGGPYYLSVKHPGAARELDFVRAQPCCRDHAAAFVLGDEMALRSAISAVYRLSKSLPTLPLETFVTEAAKLDATEAMREQKVRIGQDIFRAALLEYWNSSCPLTGISDPALLRASHMRPWALCESDAQRLDVHNGLLLSALWDAAFDQGLVTFTDQGRVIPSPALSPQAATALDLDSAPSLSMRSEHLGYLGYHRLNVWKSE